MIALRKLVERRPDPVFERSIIAYRAWVPGPHGTLRSLTTRDHWGTIDRAAICARPVQPGQRPHTAPDRRCNCGNYAVSSLELARRAAAHTRRVRRWGYALAVALLLTLAIAIGDRPSWGARAQGAALLVLAIGTAIGYVRGERSVVYGAVLAWGDVALDVVRGGVQVRAQWMCPIALVSSPAADRIGARLGLPVAPARSIAAVAREVSDGVEIDPAQFARRGPLDWVGWGLGMIALGGLHLGCLAAFAIARSIVFMAALIERRGGK